MRETRIVSMQRSPAATITRTLLALPDRSGTSAAIDSVLIAASGLSGGLGALLGPVDIWTSRGIEPAAGLIERAVRPASAPGRGRRLATAFPRSLRPGVGDVRTAVRGYSTGRRATGNGGGDYGLVIQFHHRFHRAGQRAAAKLSVPFILRLEALEVREERDWGIRRPGFGGLVERLGELPVIRAAHLVLPVSRELDHQLGSLGIDAGRRLVLPNGVDVDAFSPGRPDAALIQNLGLRDRFVVGWIGGFRPFHGLGLARSIADGLAERVPDAVLCLLGSGPGWESLRSELVGRPNVRVLPAVPHPQIPRWIRTFDACLLLAANGGFHYSPLKLFEYMACGRPVIASAAGDVPSYVSDGRDGVLVEPGDPRAVVRAIEMVAGDPETRARVATGARATAERAHSWDARAVALIQGLQDRGLLRGGRDR